MGCVLLISFGALAQMGERQLCKLDVIGSIPIGSTKNRPPLLNPAERPRESDGTCCCNSKDYLGRLQRPDVSNQGTLRVVALFAPMVKLADTLGLGSSPSGWGFKSL